MPTTADVLTLSDGSAGASNTIFSFDTGVQGWAGEGSASVSAESTIVHDGAGSLHIAQIVASGANQTVRANDSNGNTAVESSGSTLAVWCFIPSGTPGTTWRANIELQDSSFSYHSGSDVNITKGTWTQITYQPTHTVWTGHKAIAVQFSVDDATGTNCDLYIDTVTQFNPPTLPRSVSLPRTVSDTLTLSDAASRGGNLRTTTDTLGLSDSMSGVVLPWQFATIGATTSTQVNAVAAAGCTHNVVVAFWDQLQPSGAGTSLDSTALAALNTVIGLNITAGLKTILEHALHYPPSWVVSAVEPFKDQGGNVWSGTSGNGDQVRNWMWTSLGRTYVADFLTKVYAGLTSTNRAAVDRIRFGGGVFGELHYPTTAVSSPWSYWAFGSSMQTGTGLATGLTAAPDVAYTPFTGTTTQDNNFISWYLGGIQNWMTWYAGELTTVGWTCDLMCLHPGYGIRSNQVHTDAGYRQALSVGEDPARMIAAYASNAQVWPWCTWIDGTDGFIPPSVDSDQAAWKKVYAEAFKNNKHYRIWGENTGGETTAQMGQVFHNAMIRQATPVTGDPIYPSGTTPPTVFPGYAGMMWLNYSSLTAGGTNATLAAYQGLITHQWPLTYRRGISDSGGEFGGDIPSHIPGTYNTDYHYDSAASLAYLASRGHKIVRFPFLWERIQRTLGGSLDATELGRLQTYVSNANSAGLGVVLDVHNFCRYTNGGTVQVLGDGVLTQAKFVDLWTKLSTAFNGVPGIAGYGLMNEPNTLSGTAGSFSGTVRYDWNDGTVQGWTGDAATASNVSNKLRLSATVGSGTVNFRKDDAATLRGGTLSGNTLQAVVTLGSGVTNLWYARLQWQNSSFAWQSPTSTAYIRVDTGAVVSNLIAGVAVTVQATWAGGINSPIAFAIQIESSTATAGSVTADIDDFAQGAVTGGQTAAQVWEAAAQAAVTAIRGNGDTTPVMVAGYGWSSADNWPSNHPAAFITDSANRSYYEAHLYFDDNASGVYANSFATETTDANSESFYSVTGRARTRLSHFTDWCATQNVKGFIGEMGWPSGTDAASWNAVGAAVYADADRAGFWVTYWATGEWFFTTYPLSAYVEHSGGTALDTPQAQAPIIELHPSVMADLTGRTTDTLGLSDTVARAAQSFSRTLLNPMYPGSGLFPGPGIYPGSSPDWIELADTVTPSAVNRAAADSIGLADVQARAALSRTRTTGDGVGLADVQVRASTRIRTVADGVGVADVQARASQTRTRTTADTVGLADVQVGVSRHTRTTSDGIGLADTPTVAALNLARAYGDSVGLADVQTRAALSRTRTVADGVGLADVASKSPLLTRTIADAVGLSDTVGRSLQAFTRGAADTAGLADVQLRAGQSLARAGADTIGVADAVVRASQALARTAGGMVALSDSVSSGRVAGIADTLTLSDTAVRSGQPFTRPVVDGVGLADAAAGNAALHRAAADTLGLADVQARAVQLARAATDTVHAADTATEAASLPRAAADTAGLADAQTRGLLLPRAGADSLGVSDTQSRAALNLARGGSDTLSLSDVAAVGSHHIVLAATDTLQVADLVARSVADSRAVLDALAAADTAGKASTFSRAVVDGWTFTDTAGAVSSRSRTTADAVGLVDVQRLGFARVAADMVGLADAATPSGIRVHAPVADRLALADVVNDHLVVLPLQIGTPFLAGCFTAGTPAATGAFHGNPTLLIAY